MTNYEILLMLDPEAPEDRHDEILARTRELIEKGGGAWTSHEPWGRRRLTYEINHKSEGTYHLIGFSCEPETLAEISRVLKITDGVMRHMPTKRLKNPGRSSGPPPRDPEPAPDFAASEED